MAKKHFKTGADAVSAACKAAAGKVEVLSSKFSRSKGRTLSKYVRKLGLGVVSPRTCYYLRRILLKHDAEVGRSDCSLQTDIISALDAVNNLIEVRLGRPWKEVVQEWDKMGKKGKEEAKPGAPVAAACTDAAGKVNAVSKIPGLGIYIGPLQRGSVTVKDCLELRRILFRFDNEAEVSGSTIVTQGEVMSAMGAVNAIIEALTGKTWNKVVAEHPGAV